jgi:hypothetical protein
MVGESINQGDDMRPPIEDRLRDLHMPLTEQDRIDAVATIRGLQKLEILHRGRIMELEREINRTKGDWK